MAVLRLDDLGERLGIALKDPEAIQPGLRPQLLLQRESARRLGAQRAPRVPRRRRHRPDRQPAALRALPRRGRGTPHRPPRRARQPRRPCLAGPPDRAGPLPPARPGRVRGRGRHPPIGPGRRLRGARRRDLHVRGHRRQPRLADGACSTRPLPGADEPEPPKSAKSRLQEWSQREHRIKPHYELVNTTGPDHDQTFTVAAVLRGERIAIGRGSSRQRAEEQAASAALDSMGAPGLEV